MLKKISFIAALVAVLAIVFVGCTEAGVGDGKAPFVPGKTVWKLTTDGLGAVTNGTWAGAGVPALSPAGGSDDVAFVVNANKSLSVTTVATWGAGIDLNDSFFEFEAGDKIAVKVSSAAAVAGDATTFVYVTTKAGAGETNKFGPITVNGTATVNITLTQTNVDDIQATGDNLAQAIRVAAKPALTFTIDEITVERIRLE